MRLHREDNKEGVGRNNEERDLELPQQGHQTVRSFQCRHHLTPSAVKKVIKRR